MKQRWFNYRPLCLIFAFLLLGSVFAFYLLKELVFVAIIASTITLALILLAIYKRKPQYAIVPIIAFLVGVSAYYLAVASYNSKEADKPNIIQTRVYNITNEQNGMMKLECDNCFFDGK